MTTATLSPPEAKAPAVPKYAGLAIDVDCELDSKTQTTLDKYHRDCCSFETAVDRLYSSRAALLNGAIDLTLSKIIGQASDLNKERRALEVTLCELRWRRFNLLPQLVPSFRQAVAKADAEYDQSLADAREYFAAVGFTVESIPHPDPNKQQTPYYSVNPSAAEILFLRRLKEHESVGVAQAQKNLAAVALRTLYSQISNAPRPEACWINWQGAPAGIASDIARMVDLDADAPRRSWPKLQGQAWRVANDCGLADAALLDAHVRTIEAIATALGSTTFYHPLAHAKKGKELEQVRSLLAELPETQEIKRFLAATINGPVTHLI